MDGNVIAIHQRTPLGPQRSLRRPWPRETLGLGLRLPGHRTSRVPPINHLDSLPPGEKPGPPWCFGVSTPSPALSPCGPAPGLRWLRWLRWLRFSSRKGCIRPTGAGSESTPGQLPPRTPTCPPRRRSTRPARPASPRPAVRGQCAGAAADASAYVRARRWRRRGKQREESGERQGSLKRAAMALRSPQVAAGPRPRLEGAPRRGGRAAGRAAGERPHPGPERGVWEWGRAPGHAAWD